MGFGSMRLTADPDREVAVAVLRRAIELGVNHLDTAAFYVSPGGTLGVGEGPSRYATELIRDAPVVSFLKSGCGFGGSCFPKDLGALAAFGVGQGVPMEITSAVLAVNRSQPERLVSLLGDVRGKRVAVLGVSFKPGTDDIRESPAIDIISSLYRRGADVVAFDPVAKAPDVPHASTLEETLAGADAVVLVTAWPEFASVPALLEGRQIPVADGRRMWSPDAFLDYRALGRA